jgi:hypothetical protein
MMRWIAIPIVIALLLGMVANVAVTWYLTATSEWQTSGVADGRAWAMNHGYLKVFWFRRSGAEDVMAVVQENPPEADLLASTSTPPSWFPLDAARTAQDDISSGQHLVRPPARARGWPLLSFWDEGILEAGATAHFDRVLPLRPIWRGLLMNIVFYACILMVVWIVARVIRRAARKSHDIPHEPRPAAGG